MALLGNAPAGAQVDLPETRTVALDVGWNLTGWTGPDTPLAGAIASIADVTGAAATFDAASQSFDTWNADGPGFLNTLDTVLQGQAVWVLVTAPVDWVQPVVADPGALALRSGFNLVTWTGPSALEPAESFTAIGAALNAAFAFDKPTETFASFGPSRPDFLNDLPPLIYGDGFWLLMDTATSWAQPAASAPLQVTGTDIAATLEIPRGALLPGINVDDIQITDGSANPVFLPDSGPEPLRVVQLEPSGLRFAAPVTLTTSLTLPSGTAPIVLLVSGDTVQPIFAVTAAFDSESELTTLAIPISHFSDLHIFPENALEAPLLVDVGEQAVGATFTASVPITRLDFQFEKVKEHSPGLQWITRARPPLDEPVKWTLFRGIFRVVNGPLTPSVAASERLEADPGARQLDPEATFTCSNPGDFSISLDASLSIAIRGTVTLVFDDPDPEIAPEPPVDGDAVILIQSGIIGTCVAPGNLDFGSNGELSDTILIGTSMTVIVSDFTAPLTDADRLPITITVSINGVLQQTVTIDSAATSCGSANVCSADMDEIDAQPGDEVEVIARDATGAIIASASLTAS